MWLLNSQWGWIAVSFFTVQLLNEIRCVWGVKWLLRHCSWVATHLFNELILWLGYCTKRHVCYKCWDLSVVDCLTGRCLGVILGGFLGRGGGFPSLLSSPIYLFYICNVAVQDTVRLMLIQVMAINDTNMMYTLYNAVQRSNSCQEM